MIVVNNNGGDSMVAIDVDRNQVRITKWDRTAASDSVVGADGGVGFCFFDKFFVGDDRREKVEVGSRLPITACNFPE